MLSGEMLIKQKSLGKEQNSMNKLIFLLNPKDTKVLEALIAWTSIDVKFDVKLEKPNGMEDWDFLWNCSEFDLIGYSITLGVDKTTAKNRLMQLKNLKLVYPDGTLNEYAEALVKSHIKKCLSKVKVKDE